MTPAIMLMISLNYMEAIPLRVFDDMDECIFVLEEMIDVIDEPDMFIDEIHEGNYKFYNLTTKHEMQLMCIN